MAGRSRVRHAIKMRRRTQGAAGGLLSSIGGLAKKALGLGIRTLPGGAVAVESAKLVGHVAGTSFNTGRKIGDATLRGLGLTASPDPGLFGSSKKKYRRMNPANGKAIKRAVRRIKAAEKMFRGILSVQGKPHAGIKPKGRR